MKSQKGARILTCFYLLPFSLMVFFNIGNSLLRTTYFDLYQYVEAARYRWNNPLLLIAATGVFLWILYSVLKARDDQSGCQARLASFMFPKKVNVAKLAIGFSGMISLISVLLFQCLVSADSEALSDIAIEFLQGNYQAFERGEYLYVYPFQIGMTALLEFIYRIFGIENFIVFQMINIVCIELIISTLNKITWELFEDERVSRMEALLSMGMLPLFLFATFVYGDIIGWAFGVGNIYFVIRYLKTDQWQNILKAAVALALGTVVKSNINILTVAAVIAMLLHAIIKRSYKILIWTIIVVLISQAGTVIVNGIYAQRAGLERLPEGVPKIAWIAMGLQEGDEGGYACGWYNSYNWSVYVENGYDRERTTQACLDNLSYSLQKLFHEQRYALNYMYKKFTSQWNMPTFQSLLVNEWNSRHVEHLSSVAVFFIYGFGRDILYEFMNFYHFLLFLCCGVYCRFSLREWSLERAYFVLNIFGGFLFHMIWEAKTRYVMGYFVLFLPLAAWGLNKLIEMIENKSLIIQKIGRKTGGKTNK